MIEAIILKVLLYCLMAVGTAILLFSVTDQLERFVRARMPADRTDEEADRAVCSVVASLCILWPITVPVVICIGLKKLALTVRYGLALIMREPRV